MPSTLSAQDYAARIRALAVSESLRAPQNLARHGLLVLGLVLVAWLKQDLRFVLWGLGYALSDGSLHLHLKRAVAQTQATRNTYRLVLIHYACSAAYFATLPIWLITMSAIEMQFAGLTLIAGLGMHTLIHRATQRDVAIIDAIVVTLIAHAFALQWGRTAENWSAAIIMFTVSSGIAILFLQSLRQMHLTLRSAEADRHALTHAQKMEAIGRLSGGIAHDFNNLLTVIAGNLDLLEETQSPAERAVLREEARGAVDRGAGLVRQLLAASRKSALNVEEINVVAFLKDFHTLAGRTLPANLNFVQRGVPPKSLVVLADRSQLEAALLNLVINARDAMEPHGGKLWIAAQSVELPPTADVVRQGVLRAGRFLRIDVQDSGHGIPEALLAKVTEPYMTTKPEGKGTGMGLAMVNGFADQSGGALVIDSTAGQGTCVRLFLPI